MGLNNANAYGTGTTRSTDFPTLNPYQGNHAGGSYDPFAFKYNCSGEAYVIGSTYSTDFPTASPYQGSHGGGNYDAFVTRFDSSGGVNCSTYLGGSGYDWGRAIAVDEPLAGCANQPVRNLDTSAEYATLQEAYDAAGDGHTIQSHEAVFTENLDIDWSISVTFEGGYDCDYAVVTGKTKIEGSMTTTFGTVTIGNFILE